MEDKNKPFGGFDAIFTAFNTNDEENEIVNLDVSPNDKKPFEENEEEEEIDDDTKDNKDDDEETDDNKDDKDDDEEEADDDENNEEGNEGEDDNKDEDLASEQVTAFFDAISENLGWEFDEDEEKPKTVEELIDYITDVIEENSTPEFASDDVKAINEYVANGGDIEKYFSVVNTEIDYDDIDLDDVSVQKSVLKEFLKEKGHSDKMIQKKLDKYEEAGILQDEAEDAAEEMKIIKEEKKKALLETQKKNHEAYIKQQQNFYNSVVKEIEDLKDIRGIKIPKEDKKQLLNYIFKLDSDGRSQYQKDYAKTNRNLIESAYFTMKGDKLLSAAKQSGESSAIKKFKSTLSSTKRVSSKQKMDNKTATPIWEIASRQLRRPSK
jgi:hypothetical protein